MARVATPAIVALVDRDVDHTVHDCGPARAGDEVADRLGVDHARVFKTLVVDVRGRLGCAVIPLTAQLDLKALARHLGAKSADMATRSTAERATGYVLGAISPVGQTRTLTTVVDASALSFPSVFVSAGRRGLELEIAPGDLLEMTGGSTTDLATG